MARSKEVSPSASVLSRLSRGTRENKSQNWGVWPCDVCRAPPPGQVSLAVPDEIDQNPMGRGGVVAG